MLESSDSCALLLTYISDSQSNCEILTMEFPWNILITRMGDLQSQ